MKISTAALVVTLLGAVSCSGDGRARALAASKGVASLAQLTGEVSPPPSASSPSPAFSASDVPDLTKRVPVTRGGARIHSVRARSMEVATEPASGERHDALVVKKPPPPAPARAPSEARAAGEVRVPSGPSPELEYDPIVEAAPPPVARPPAPSTPTVKRAPVAAQVDDAPITGWHPSPGVAVASGIGFAGLALGGISAGMDQPSTAMSAFGLGLGAAGFLTAGVIMFVESREPKPVEVAVGPTSMAVRGAF